MERSFGIAPSAAEIEVLALAAMARLPEPFAAHLDGVRMVVEEKHLTPSGTVPDRIRLFRAAILDEWTQRGDETLEHLVAHVVVHEVGHHFGLSDAQIEALEAGG